MAQYYAAEFTKNPIWLFQERSVAGEEGAEYWRTTTVFSSREKGNQYGERNRHNFGKKDLGWRVYAVCCHDDELARKIAELRPDLIDDYSVKV
jgi:hypothetical protein